MGVDVSTMNNIANPHSETSTSTTDTEPSIDDLFAVLTEARRRTVLSVLTESTSPMDVESLATRVAARERDVDADSLSESTVEDVHVTLHHVHLPKLDDAGLVDHDRENGTAATTGAGDTVPIDIE